MTEPSQTNAGKATGKAGAYGGSELGSMLGGAVGPPIIGSVVGNLVGERVVVDATALVVAGNRAYTLEKPAPCQLPGF